MSSGTSYYGPDEDPEGIHAPERDLSNTEAISPVDMPAPTKCKRCESQLKPNADFCGRCGKRVSPTTEERIVNTLNRLHADTVKHPTKNAFACIEKLNISDPNSATVAIYGIFLDEAKFKQAAEVLRQRLSKGETECKYTNSSGEVRAIKIVGDESNLPAEIEKSENRRLQAEIAVAVIFSVITAVILVFLFFSRFI